MKIYPKKFLKPLFIIFAALCFGLTAFLFTFSPRSVKADGNDFLFMPATPLENTELSNPTHAYADDEITAITTTDNKLLISCNNKKPTEIAFTSSLGQVLRFNNYVLYREEHNMFAVNFNDTTEIIPLTYLNGSINKPLACDNCSYNNNDNILSLAVCTEETLKIYNITEDTENKPVVTLVPYFTETIIPIKKAPVAINSTSVFYINVDGKLCKREINALGDEPIKYKAINPSAMIADEKYVYCLAGNTISRFTIADENSDPVELSIPACEYDLGVISAPVDLAFKNGNLFITDGSANGSVQEFKINNDTLELEFTGYAIASGLSAYNRVAASATNIERYGKYVAALDGKKLTVIDTENCVDYDKNGFINKFLNTAPNKFALGNGTISYLREDSVNITNITNDETVTVDTGISATALCDIGYQSGKYYVSYSQGDTTTVVKINENTGTVIENTTFNKSTTSVAVDVFGNIFVADNANVYKNNISDSYPRAGVKKLATDLAGNLFALAADGKIHKLAANADAFDAEPALDVTGDLGTIKTFGMDFDRSEVYFLIDGKEQVYRTANAGNVSLEDVTPNDGFINATASKQELKVYSVKNEANANVYSVSQDGNAFKFNGLIEKATEYAFIADIKDGGNTVTLCALASKNGVVLINKSELEEKAVAPATAPEKAFLTTSVYAYAIPVIERNGTFAMANESGTIKIDKGATVTVNGAFTLLNRTFYDATAKVNGEDLPCYIPADFTATVLAENFEFESYTVEKVKKTVLYKNDDLTEELFELEDGETVKLLERKDGVLKVAATRQEGTVVGYITENSLTSNPSVIVRNVLIILAVFGSLAGTISYFLLRKKR